jgi:hypothetical protein
MNSVRIRNPDFVHAWSDQGECPAKLLMQCVLVVETPSHIGASAPSSQAQGQQLKKRKDWQSSVGQNPEGVEATDWTDDDWQADPTCSLVNLKAKRCTSR